MTGGPNNSERQAFIEVPEARDPAGAARSEPTISRTTRPKGTTSRRATRRAPKAVLDRFKAFQRSLREVKVREKKD